VALVELQISAENSRRGLLAPPLARSSAKFYNKYTAGQKRSVLVSRE